MTTANTDGVVLVPLVGPRCERRVALWWRVDRTQSMAVEATKQAILGLPEPRWPWGDRFGGSGSV